MIWSSLINMAVLTYFAISSGHGINFDLHAGREPVANGDHELVGAQLFDLSDDVPAGRLSDPQCITDLHYWGGVSAKAAQRIVLRENTLSEELGLETITRPDKEIIALQSSVSGLKSVLAWSEQVATGTSGKLPRAIEWKSKRVVCLWDEDGGFYVGGTYFPMYEEPLSAFSIGPRPGTPFRCVLSVGAGRGDDVYCTAFEPDSVGSVQEVASLSYACRIIPDLYSRGRTPNDFYDYPDLRFTLDR